MKMKTAGIQNLDKDKIPARIAARGGLGAVMATKGIKAIVFDASGGQKPPIVNPQAYKEAQKIYNKAVIEHPSHKPTATMVRRRWCRCASIWALCQHEIFPSGQFEQAEAISGENMRELLLERGGESNPTHACMPGCTIRCSNVFGGEDGKMIVSPLEYETIGLMGSNLGIGCLDVIARMNWQVNDLGVDSIDVGAALGVAAEAGLMKWGDGDRALELIDEIRQGTPLGRILGSGAGYSGKSPRYRAGAGDQESSHGAYEPTGDQRHGRDVCHLAAGRRSYRRTDHQR